MHWVLQNNLYSEEGWGALVGALDRLGSNYSVHKCVPFIGALEPEASPPPGNVIVMGSYTLANHAKKRGWTPGAWLDNLDFETQRDFWWDRMLNFDAQCGSLGKLTKRYSPFFMRPVHDTKSFTGRVFDWPEYQEWIEALSKITPEDYSTVTLDTQVMVCRKKEIHTETRTWIVKGKVITASGYKMGTLKRYTPPEMVDKRITDFAQSCADIWCPNDAFVLDVAETPYTNNVGRGEKHGMRIVEINNLNSAGFYKADMNKLVHALESI